MKRIILILSIPIVSLSLAHGQNITLEKLKKKLKNDDFGNFARAVANNDLETVFTYLDSKLDRKPIEKVFTIIGSKYDHFTWDIEHHFNNGYVPMNIFGYGVFWKFRLT
jgi:hypothetical protein